MDRRSFISTAGGAALAAVAGAAGFKRWQEIDATVHYPGRDEGHYLRDQSALPPPSASHRDGHRHRSVPASPAWPRPGSCKRSGHARRADDRRSPALRQCGRRALRRTANSRPAATTCLCLRPNRCTCARSCSTWASCSRTPTPKSRPTTSALSCTGRRSACCTRASGRMAFCRPDGVPAAELAQHRRFFAEVERLRQLRGSDGRRIFVFPTVLSSTDPAFDALDRITLKQWLDQNGYTLAHPALVSELLLPRRLRHPLRQGVGVGGPALLLQPLGPGGQCGQRRLADLAGRDGAGGGGAGGQVRHRATSRHGGVAERSAGRASRPCVLP